MIRLGLGAGGLDGSWDEGEVGDLSPVLLERGGAGGFRPRELGDGRGDPLVVWDSLSVSTCARSEFDKWCTSRWFLSAGVCCSDGLGASGLEEARDREVEAVFKARGSVKRDGTIRDGPALARPSLAVLDVDARFGLVGNGRPGLTESASKRLRILLKAGVASSSSPGPFGWDMVSLLNIDFVHLLY